MKHLLQQSIFRRLLGAVIVAAAVLNLASCSKDTDETTYTVTIVSNGGTNFAPIHVRAGECIPLNKLSPDPITIDGGTFMYWCADKALKNKFDFSTPVTADMALYAKWHYVEFTVTFQMNGAPAIEPQVLRTGRALEYFRPEYTGKVFGGWYTDAACSQLYDFYNSQVKADMTLYAKWYDPSPASWFTINNGVLQGCQVPAGTETVVVPEGVTTVGQWFVLANSGALLNVKEFILPQSLQEIQVGAFKGSAITRMIIPPHVKTLTSFTFQDCPNLATFVFEPGSEFESFTVNDNLEPVLRTPALASLLFPASFKDMDGYSIAPACTALKTLTFLRSESAVTFHIRGGGSLWLFGGYYPTTLKVPAAAKDLYLAALRTACANDYDYTQMTNILTIF